jgi:hypothetical protein
MEDFINALLKNFGAIPYIFFFTINKKVNHYH